MATKKYYSDLDTIVTKDGEVIILLSGRVSKKGVTPRGEKAADIYVSVQNQAKGMAYAKSRAGDGDLLHNETEGGDAYDTIRVVFWNRENNALADRAKKAIHGMDEVQIHGRVKTTEFNEKKTLEVEGTWFKVLRRRDAAPADAEKPVDRAAEDEPSDDEGDIYNML